MICMKRPTLGCGDKSLVPKRVVALHTNPRRFQRRDEGTDGLGEQECKGPGYGKSGGVGSRENTSAKSGIG